MKVGRGARGLEVGEEDDPSGGGGGVDAVPPPKRRRAAAPAAGAGGSRRVQAEASPLQRLFHACRAVFRGPGTVPAPDEVDLLCSMLDRMKPEDVGLSAAQEFFRNRDVSEGAPLIKNTTLYESENFTMVIFFLPRNAIIPLHDHPGMTVFSKLLIGALHIRSYDWVDPEPASCGGGSSGDQCKLFRDPDISFSQAVLSSPSCILLCANTADLGRLVIVAVRLAKRVVNGFYTAPCDTSVLYPTTGGNLHRFRAVAPCAILDIIGPPYSTKDGRDCTYYAAIPYSRQSTRNGAAADLSGVDEEGRRLSWLKETVPRQLRMRNIRYGGPPISDDDDE
ncbi:hypothetical protein GUJ93_ZPchr0012g19177 [Zizania palustris]|uniref:cysteine dioxygenase n=1 Tax=Zizania palustris TaxID=103762 RepID=A0A8J6BTC8_ZIZPA|nr:hypothetical protein GUJ93_ZPchr0012g19177 [Zizania palustris]